LSNTELQDRELVSSLPRLWRYCIVLTQERSAADDLVQTTCLRALERFEQFRGESTFDRWLIRIARNLWFNQIKAERIRKNSGLIPSDQISLGQFPDSPEENTYMAQVFSAVIGLPEAQREVVLLVYIEGWSYREAAETLKIPVGTVMSRLAAARRKLSVMNDRDVSTRDKREQEHVQ